ncbi:hypothetical protein [Sedimentibacter sp. B4]|uniref:hypothetical protein n=1 Tax=Sedimentibacter sp. B4 TaxID=304766 RepID=UPI0002E9E80D|nr:hypothetical protein [Sedimentibacter sp. B4]
MKEFEIDLKPGMYCGCKEVQQMILDNPGISEKLKNITPWLENWTGAFLHSVYHHFKDVKSFNSILFCALEAQTMQLDWIRFSFCSGQYDIALRELRNVIESGSLFFKYDYMNEFRNLSVAEKYDAINNDITINQKNGFGKTVFQNSGYIDWLNVYNNIYKPLCKYIHTGNNIERAMDIDKNGFNEILEPYYYDVEIENCILYFKKVVHTEVKMMEIILKDVYDIDDEYISIFE